MSCGRPPNRSLPYRIHPHAPHSSGELSYTICTWVGATVGRRRSNDRVTIARTYISFTHICDVLGISRSSCYAWLESKETLRDQEDKMLAPKVHAVFMRHCRQYGSRRVAKEVAAVGLACGRRRVSRPMNSQGLRAIQPRSFRPQSTQSKHRLGYSPELLLTESASAVGQVWVGDLTYIPCQVSVDVGLNSLRTLDSSPISALAYATV